MVGAIANHPEWDTEGEKHGGRQSGECAGERLSLLVRHIGHDQGVNGRSHQVIE